MDISPNDLQNRMAERDEERQRQKAKRNLILRNMLNAVFILLALITMTCIGLYWKEPETPAWCYQLGIVAVIVKMCEALLRMPGLGHQPRKNQLNRHRRRF